jgi:hypothetical protein
MEARRSSKTSVEFHCTKTRYIPDEKSSNDSVFLGNGTTPPPPPKAIQLLLPRNHKLNIRRYEHPKSDSWH